MKRNKAVTYFTVIGLSTYQLYQTFLVDQVQPAHAAEVAQDQSDQPLVGDHLKITVKSYPKQVESDLVPSEQKRVEPDKKNASRREEQVQEQNEKPNDSSADELQEKTEPEPAQIDSTSHSESQKEVKEEHQNSGDNEANKSSSADEHQVETSAQRAQKKKHLAQVERDIAMFHGGANSPTPSHTTTNVGAFFGELAGRSLFSAR